MRRSGAPCSGAHGDAGAAGALGHGTDVADQVAGRRDHQVVGPAAEGEADVPLAGADDDVPGHREVAGSVIDLGDGDVHVDGVPGLAAVVEHLVAVDRGSDAALGGAVDAVPGARVLPGPEVLDVVAGDRRPVQPG